MYRRGRVQRICALAGISGRCWARVVNKTAESLSVCACANGTRYCIDSYCPSAFDWGRNPQAAIRSPQSPVIFLEIIRLAFSSLAANKLRSILTMVGIAVGIFTVIGVMTAVSGVQSKIESGLNVLGANSFQLQ